MADERNDVTEETAAASAHSDAPEEADAAAQAGTEAQAKAEQVSGAEHEVPAEKPVAEMEAGAKPAAEEPAAEEPAAENGVKPAAEDTAAETGAKPAAEAPPVDTVAATSTDAARGETSEPSRKKKRLPRRLRRQRTTPAREQAARRKPIVRLEKPVKERGGRQERQGTVVSSAPDKTIVVKVDVVKAHPRYKKVVRRSTKFHAHDERNEAKVGDVVRIVETRPISKQKRWRLAEILEVAK